MITTILTAIQSVTSSVLNAMKSAVSNMFNNVVSSICNAMGNIYNTIVSGFKQKEKIGVEYFDMETLEMRKTEMFVEGYQAGLVKDTSYKGL